MLALAVVGVMVLALPVAAVAQEPARLQTQVTDLTSGRVLAGGQSRIDAALAELRQNRNVQLFVLFVDTTGGQTVTEYADAAARRSSLGGNDALLVVALGDRSDALWRGAQLRDSLTDRDLEAILSNRVEPLLAQGDFPGAVVAATTGLADAVVGDVSTTGTSAGGSAAVAPILAVLGAGAGGVWLWGRYSKRKGAQATAAATEQQAERRAQEANDLLIRVDETLRDAEQEMAFAELQFGRDEVVPYREAVARASTDLKSAFSLRQRLDDDVPESPVERGQLVDQILEQAGRAQTTLEEQQQRIELLQDIERRAPEILAGLSGQIDAQEARIPEAERTLEGLKRYAEQNWASVVGNPQEAHARLATARTALAEGQQAQSKQDKTGAGHGARIAQQAMTAAGQLLDAINALRQSLEQAEATASAEIAEAARDLPAAQAAISGGASADLRARAVQAERALEQARSALASSRPDVLTAAKLATEADAIADQILAEVHEAEERRTGQARILEAQIQSAESAYLQASHYIAGRRSGMGSGARTRLAEAERYLDQARALAGSNIESALAAAQRAQALADQAYALAQQDVQSFGPYGGWGRGGTIPVPFPIPMGGGWGGGFGRGGGGFGGGGSWGGGGGFGGGGGGGSVGGGGGGSVGGRW
jgi:uncharacterized protein HemX